LQICSHLRRIKNTRYIKISSKSLIVLIIILIITILTILANEPRISSVLTRTLRIFIILITTELIVVLILGCLTKLITKLTELTGLELIMILSV